MRLLILLALCMTLVGCELIPRRNAKANAQLYQAVLAELSALEAAGMIDPSKPAAVVLARYGTSVGGSIPLAARHGDGRRYTAQEMIASCQKSTGTHRARRVKRCLRTTFASGETMLYSHAGIAFRLPGRAWQVRQSLRSIETSIHQQWYSTLEQFVDISLIDTRLMIMVPDLDLQERLVRGFLVYRSGQKLITPVYNLVADPFQTREQMSNQFVLELLAMAMQPADMPISRANAQAKLRALGYEPTIIQLGGVQTLTKYDNLFGTIDLSAQPYTRRYEIGEMITVLSMRKFMRKTGRIQAIRDVAVE